MNLVNPSPGYVYVYILYTVCRGPLWVSSHNQQRTTAVKISGLATQPVYGDWNNPI